MIATTTRKLRQQWLQFALAAVAFIAVGVVLAMVFGSGSDDPETQPGATGSPGATVTATTPDATSALSSPMTESMTLISFPTQPPTTDHGQALLHGQFTNINGCLWVILDEGTQYPIFWPNGYHWSDDGGIVQVHDQTGTVVAQVGDIISIVGGEGPVEPGRDACLSAEKVWYAAGPVEVISSALPTPEGTGMYRGITVDQARQIVPFEIVVPELVPEGFEPPVLSVVERRIPSAPGARIYEVEMVYELSGDESPAKSVKFSQLGPNGGDLQLANTDSTTTITANGVEVTRLDGRSVGGDPILAYTWEHADLNYIIFATPAGDLTPELVDALMQDIFAIYTPTAESESARLEQERAELMTVPVPDSCVVSSWAGPDFRIRRSASAAYFVEGEGLTLGTTHGFLFAGQNQITWLASAPLTNEEALSGPRTMTIFRSDVVGDPIPVEIPIEDAQQIDRGILPDSVERGWTSTVYLPEEGCWEFQISLGAHSLMARVFVYPPPAQSDVTYDEALVEQIALADPRVQALLADHPHQVSGVGMWTGDRGRLIGGFAAISVGGPRNIAGEWFEYSMLDCEAQPPPDPVVVSYRAEFAGVTEIHVLVDLSTEAVVLIYPFWEDVSLVGDREFTGKYDEIRQCDTGD